MMVIYQSDKVAEIFETQVDCYNSSFCRQIRPVCISVSQKPEYGETFMRLVRYFRV